MSCARKLIFIILTLLLLYACTPEATPVSTPKAAYLGTTPSHAQWVEQWVQGYWEQFPGNGVIPLIYPLEAAIAAVENGEVELLISASTPPEGWFVTPLYRDAIAVIVDPAADIETLDLEQLEDIFRGRVENWIDLGGQDQLIQAVIPLEGDEIRSAFQIQVLHGARYTSSAYLAPNPAAAFELLEAEPGSIAFVPLTSVPPEWTPLLIQNVRPTPSTINNDRYPLTLDVLAFAPEEPQGTMRQFLGWYQETLLTDN